MTDGENAAQADGTLSDEQMMSLRMLVTLIIPASDDHGVPGADDPVIFDRIAAAAMADRERVADALEALDQMAEASHGAPFATLQGDARADVAAGFAASESSHVETLTGVTVQRYYSDPRVLTALGMEERPPFPQGYDVPQGDWSLLNPVKRRPKFYRGI